MLGTIKRATKLFQKVNLGQYGSVFPLQQFVINATFAKLGNDERAGKVILITFWCALFFGGMASSHPTTTAQPDMSCFQVSQVEKFTILSIQAIFIFAS